MFFSVADDVIFVDDVSVGVVVSVADDVVSVGDVVVVVVVVSVDDDIFVIPITDVIICCCYYLLLFLLLLFLLLMLSPLLSLYISVVASVFTVALVVVSSVLIDLVANSVSLHH